MSARKYALSLVLLATTISEMSCDMGPFPDFLEPLDSLVPLEGDAQGWILAEASQTQILVLGEGGQFLHSVINRNTSVVLEVGTIQVQSSSLAMHSSHRYEFPKESGPVTSRSGAQSEAVDVEVTRAAQLDGSVLTIEGWGAFVTTSSFVTGLNLELERDRGCLLRLVQLSLRTAQARIRNFGGSGTAIYHNNEATFSGFLRGKQSILLENILSPDTSIAYSSFSDVPEIEIGGVLLSHVSTSGSGYLDRYNTFQIFGEPADVLGVSQGGAGGSLGEASGTRPLLATGELVYATSDPVQIVQGDVAGGVYELAMDEPRPTSDTVAWSFLEDLDLRGCYEPPAPSDTKQ